MTLQTNTPELRFPEFRDNWEKKRLGNLSSQSMYGIGASAIEFDKKNVYVRITDIDEDTRKLTGNYTSPNTIDEKYLLETNDILFARTGASTGKSYIHNNFDRTLKYYFAGFLIKFKIEDNYSSNFIYQYTYTEMYKNWVKVMSMRSGQPGINSEEYSKLSLCIPKKGEQEKIGDFFSKLDRQIELEEKKLELLEQQKRGYMQKIFAQELRFKDENENDYPDWEETTLKNITNYISSKKSSNQYNESNNSEGYPVYDAIQEIGKDLQYDMKEPYISILKDGAGVGRLNLRAGKSSVIGTMGYIQANNVDIQFLYYRMKLLNFRKFIIGSTIPHLYYKDYSKEKILIPTSNDEQKKIGHFILNIDKLINNKTLKLDYLKQRKQGLLQKMFI